MTLYSLYAEVFLQNIRKNKNIKGIICNDTEIKVSAYADDTTLYTKDHGSINEIEKEMERFKYITWGKVQQT